VNRWISALKTTFGRGIFPHELSFLLELPLRSVLLSPRKLAHRLGLTSTSRVLEVGSGSGFYSVEVARRTVEGHLQLLDLQTEMLQKARAKLRKEGLGNIGLTVADGGRLPFKQNGFDVIFLVAVLGEIENRGAFLREAHRALKPQGVLSISEHFPDPDFLRLAKVKLLVEKEGFEFLVRHGVSWNYTANFRKSMSDTPQRVPKGSK
jgi:ubiquinone/menaquinone biosynthesis C-methylase UbiE